MAYERLHSVVYHDPGKAYQGYTLIGPQDSREVYLIDMQGRVVHQWGFASYPAAHSVFLPAGNLLRPQQGPLTDEFLKIIGVSLGARGGEIVEVDWEGNLVWKWEDQYQNHTVTRLSNGNTMVLRFVRVPEEIVTEVPGGFPGTEFSVKGERLMYTDGLQEVTPDGRIVWEWMFFEHVKPQEWPICPLCPRHEWTHANSVIEMPDGNVLMCCRNISRIFIIDKKTGDIVWRWGEGELAHSHDPTIAGNGNILIFDNGGHRLDGSNISFSRAIEINPKTGKIDWEYRSNPVWDFYSAVISGCQRLPNGNTLICEGTHGRVFEITHDGEVVWEFVNPWYSDRFKDYGWGKTNWVWRAYRFGPDYPGLKNRELDPGNHQSLNQIYSSTLDKTQPYTRRKHSVTNHEPAQAYNGFTLISPLGSNDACLIDMKGQSVHRWQMPGYSCELLPNGNLLGITKEGLLELDWEGNKIWSYEDRNASKGFYRMDNGNTLYLRSVAVPDDIATRVKGGIAGTGKDGMIVNALREVSPSGKIVWEWLGYENLDPELDTICTVCHRDQWTDGDSCMVLDNGNILVCFSRTHNIYIIEKETGNIEWRWGIQELAHPHHATVLNSGNILIFDSGLHPYGAIPIGFSRLVEVDPKENKMVWEYREKAVMFFYSTFMGGCQRLPNGNTLITESQTGRLFEIASESKENVWEFINPFYSDHPVYGHNNILFRAYRYGPEYPGIRDKKFMAEKLAQFNM